MDQVAARLNKLSDICADIGQVSLASVVFPFLLEEFNQLMVIWGVMISVGFWALSLLLARE